jgi:hypothetical protein
MKKILSFIIMIVLVVSSCGTVNAAKTTAPVTDEGKQLFLYLQGDESKLLLKRNNYGYMAFIEDFKADVISMYCLEMADILVETGSKPDKKEYIRVLLNVIAAYDCDRAADVSEQKKMDNMKSFKEYAMDFTKMGVNAVSVMSGNSSSTSELEGAISKAVSCLDVLTDNTDNWINALSDLEAVTKDYSEHDVFLKTIEDNSQGELKEAAHTLREGMKKAFEIRLKEYNKISNENFENFEEFFFSDMFFDLLKQIPEYAEDDTLRFFVDESENLISVIGTLNASWDLGKQIGKMVGDFTVGGTNLARRVVEIMALYDISIVLEKEIPDSHIAFLDSFGKDSESICANKYIALSNYLIGCRIRGEYCIYSIVAKDAGLLSWFKKESAQEAEKWYQGKCKKIITIQNKLYEVKNSTVGLDIDWAIMPVVDADEIWVNDDSTGLCYNDAEQCIERSELAVIEKSSKFGIIDMNSKILVECKYSDYHLCTCGGVDLINEDKWYALNNNCEIQEIIDEHGAPELFLGGCGEYEAIAQKQGYDEIEVFEDGMYAAEKNGKWAYFKDGKQLSDFQFLDICNDKSAYWFPKNHSEDYWDFGVSGISGNMIAVRTEEGCGYYNYEKGEFALLSEELEEVKPIINGLAWAKDSKSNKWGILKVPGYKNTKNLKYKYMVSMFEKMDISQMNSSDEWKDAYIGYLDNNLNIYGHVPHTTDIVELIDINGDEVPELFISHRDYASGDELCTYYNGEVIHIKLGFSGMQYIEGENLFMDSYMHSDEGYDNLYSLVNGQFKLIGKGDYGAPDNSNVEWDENGPIYDYYWNDKKVSREKYEDSLNKAFDYDRAITPECDIQDTYDYKEEIVQKIREY